MSPTPTVSATAARQSPAPVSDPSVSTDVLDAPNAESEGTLIGVSAMKAQLLSQAVSYFAQIVAPSTGDASTSALAVKLSPVCLDPTTITAFSTACSTALAAAVTPQFAELRACLKATEEKVEKLQKLQAEQNEILTCQVRDLRDEVLRLIAVECSEPCGRLTGGIELLAERVEACEQALAALPRRQPQTPR
jgi:hypothetical protein